MNQLNEKEKEVNSLKNIIDAETSFPSFKQKSLKKVRFNLESQPRFLPRRSKRLLTKTKTKIMRSTCPVDGCDSKGNVNRNLKTHRTLKSCPNRYIWLYQNWVLFY